ncbi:MAG: GNAT family N-acetyltransferase, partial [Bacteroidota bacterium]
MIEIIPANKKHIASIEALAQQRPKNKPCKESHILYYLACTVLKNYSFVAIESGELIGYILSFQATAQNYVWLQEVFVNPEKYGRKLNSELLMALESHLKGIWTTPVKSIKV